MPRVKILGEGELTIALKVSGVDISKSAKAAVEKVGGTVTLFVPVVTATKIAKVADISKATERATKAVVKPTKAAAKPEKTEKTAKPAKAAKPVETATKDVTSVKVPKPVKNVSK